MALRNATPLAWSPHGLSDALDTTNTQPGMMIQLQNLIPDPSTVNLWQCRPAALELVDMNAGGGHPWTGANGFISVLEVLGNVAYGMVATSQFTGKDAPFAFNLVTKTFTTISGVTSSNTPTSPAATGTWLPPTMSLVGTKIILTHPGFNGAGNGYIGVIDISNSAAPAWSSGNITGVVTFTVPPQWVEQFNGRAFYLINPPTGAQPSIIFSDSLSPLTTSGTALPVLTFGDNIFLTVAIGLPLMNQLGGIIQSLIVFKSVSNIYQITGDAAQSNLSINSLNVATGTLAPNAVTSTPKGIMFIAPDGLRLIDFYARVTDPIGLDGQGVNVPFIFAVVPSRINAACNFNVFRIYVQNGSSPTSPNQEFWYDISREKWSGPHTFPGSMIAPFGNTFIIAPVGVMHSLWQSDVVQSSTSTFTENGVAMAWAWQTCMLPDTGSMAEFCLIESWLKLALSSIAGTVNIFAEDENGLVLDTVTVAPTGITPSIWGQFNWGQANWGAGKLSLAPYQMQWHMPIVFQRLSILATGASAQGLKIGDLAMRYQKLGYLGANPLTRALPVTTIPPPPPPPPTQGAYSAAYSNAFNI